MAHKKYELSLAGTILVYVLKPRFSSKYLDVCSRSAWSPRPPSLFEVPSQGTSPCSPHKLKFAGTPIK